MKVLYSIMVNNKYNVRVLEVRSKKDSRDIIYNGSYYKKHKEFTLNDAKAIVGTDGVLIDSKNELMEIIKEENVEIAYIYDVRNSKWLELLVRSNRWQELVESEINGFVEFLNY